MLKLSLYIPSLIETIDVPISGNFPKNLEFNGLNSGCRADGSRAVNCELSITINKANVYSFVINRRGLTRKHHVTTTTVVNTQW